MTDAIEKGHWTAVIPYHQRGVAYSATGQNALAIKDFTEVIRLNPKYAQAYLDRGLAWYKTDLDKAIADYTEAIRLDPKFAWAYCDRGLAWSAKKDPDKAIADFNDALRLDPKLGEAYLHRGKAWQAKGKTRMEMAADFAQAKRLGIDAPGPEPEAEEAPVVTVPMVVKASRVDPELLQVGQCPARR